MALTLGLALPCALPACIGARRQAPSARAGSPVAACKRSVNLLQRDAGLAALQWRCTLQCGPSRRCASRQQLCRASGAAAEGQGFESEGSPAQPAASGKAKKSLKETASGAAAAAEGQGFESEGSAAQPAAGGEAKRSLEETASAAAAEGQGLESGGAPAQSAASGEAKKSLKETLTLGALFGGWYLFNIWFNIYNKQALKVFPYPVTCTAIQFGVGSLLALTMWTLGLHKKPDLSDGVVKKISPLAAVHTLGNALTNISLGRVAVSFTHTIKAMEPFFSVLLSAMFLGEKASLPVLATLLPIVGGVAAASVSEVTFNWGGFAAAMGSNLTFQSRNVLSKKFMGDVKGKGGLDNINLFSIITIISFCILAPIALLTDGIRFTPGALRASGIADPGLLMKHVLLAAFCFHAYQQVSYMILQRVSPVTHSIGNCLKRVIVIIASVIVFQNPMSRQNMIGTGVALFGVFAYSQVKRLSGKTKAA